MQLLVFNEDATLHVAPVFLTGGKQSGLGSQNKSMRHRLLRYYTHVHIYLRD